MKKYLLQIKWIFGCKCKGDLCNKELIKGGGGGGGDGDDNDEGEDEGGGGGGARILPPIRVSMLLFFAFSAHNFLIRRVI